MKTRNEIGTFRRTYRELVKEKWFGLKIEGHIGETKKGGGGILLKEKQVWQFLIQLSVPGLGCRYTPSMPLGILPLLNEPQPGGTLACRPSTTPAMIHRAINLTREICLVLVPLAPPIITWDVVINVSHHWWNWDRLTEGEGGPRLPVCIFIFYNDINTSQ